eukprot:gene20724-27539_t
MSFVSSGGIDTCEDAIYKTASISKSPSDDFDPVNWASSDWRDYAQDYVLPHSAVSIAMLGLVVVAALFFILWRLMRLCWCFNGPPADPFVELSSRWFLAHKGLVIFFGVLAIAGAMTGMILMEHDPVKSVRTQAIIMLDYTDTVLDSVDLLLSNARAVLPTLDKAERILAEDIDAPTVVSYLRCTGRLLDTLPSPAITKGLIQDLDDVVNLLIRDQISDLGGLISDATDGLAPMLEALLGANPLITGIRNVLSLYASAMSGLPTNLVSASAVSALFTAQTRLELSYPTWDPALAKLEAGLQFYQTYKGDNLMLDAVAASRELQASTLSARLKLSPISSALTSFGTMCASISNGCVNDATSAIRYINTTVLQLDASISDALNMVEDAQQGATGELCGAGGDSSSITVSIAELSVELDRLAASLRSPPQLDSILNEAEAVGSAISTGPEAVTAQSVIALFRSALQALEAPADAVGLAVNSFISAQLGSRQFEYSQVLSAASTMSISLFNVLGLLNAAVGDPLLDWTSTLQVYRWPPFLCTLYSMDSFISAQLGFRQFEYSQVLSAASTMSIPLSNVLGLLNAADGDPLLDWTSTLQGSFPRSFSLPCPCLFPFSSLVLAERGGGGSIARLDLDASVLLALLLLLLLPLLLPLFLLNAVVSENQLNSVEAQLPSILAGLDQVERQLSPPPTGSYPQSMQPYLDAMDAVAVLDTFPSPKSRILDEPIQMLQSLDEHFSRAIHDVRRSVQDVILDEPIKMLQSLDLDSNRAISDVRRSVQDAVSSFGDDLVGDLRSDVKEARRIEEDYVGKAQTYYTDYAWKAWLGVYAAFILLVLLVVLFTWLACPGALCPFLLLTLAYLIFYMIIPVGLTTGQIVLQDGCWQVEDIALKEDGCWQVGGIALKEVGDNPDVYSLFDYYLYNKGGSLEATLLESGLANISQVRNALQEAREQIIDQIVGGYTLGAGIEPTINLITEQVDRVQNQLDRTLVVADFAPVHDQYLQLKASACCDPGDFLFTQFICMTVSGMMCWVMVIAGFLVLWRLDKMPKEGRCGCGCKMYHAADFVSILPYSASSSQALEPYSPPHNQPQAATATFPPDPVKGVVSGEGGASSPGVGEGASASSVEWRAGERGGDAPGSVVAVAMITPVAVRSRGEGSDQDMHAASGSVGVGSHGQQASDSGGGGNYGQPWSVLNGTRGEVGESSQMAQGASYGQQGSQPSQGSVPWVEMTAASGYTQAKDMQDSFNAKDKIRPEELASAGGVQAEPSAPPLPASPSPGSPK